MNDFHGEQQSQRQPYEIPPRPAEPPQARAEAEAPAGAPGRRRARGPVVWVTAAALVAAVVGGGAGALVGNHWGGERGDSTPTATQARNAAASGTVAGAAKQLAPSAVEIKAGSSTGSGVVISEDGEILTNNHVIAGADEIQVRFDDGKTATAEVVGTEPDLDTALLKAKDVQGLTAAKLGDSDAVGVGDQVVAIGSPNGLTGSVTSGIVSALEREVTTPKGEERQRQPQSQDGQNWPFGFGDGQSERQQRRGGDTTTYKAIQTDASINPGNSGGALADLSGAVIGINTAIYDNSSPASEAGSVGLGFAIPINDIKKVLDELRAGDNDNGGSDRSDGNGGADDGLGGFGRAGL